MYVRHDITDTRVVDFLKSPGDIEKYWNELDILLFPGLDEGPYIAGVACSDRTVNEVLRLRYEVFNLELGEGLSSSALIGMDRDDFDDQMHHLVLVESSSAKIIGTYRIQTAFDALACKGLYSANEFVLDSLEPYFDRSVELGRACVAQEHRSMRATHTLWLGIGGYLNCQRCQYLFGCCSIRSDDPDDGWRALKLLRSRNALHPRVFLKATPGCSCGSPAREYDADIQPIRELPKLFKSYMSLGAHVISEPAIDREFGTVDFLMLMDAHAVRFSRLDVVR